MSLHRWFLLTTAAFICWLAAPVPTRADGQPLYCTVYGYTGGSEFDAERARTIFRVDAAGKVSRFVVLPAGSEVRGLAVDSRGNVYTATSTAAVNPYHSGNRIFRITPAGKAEVFASFSAFGVQRLAFDHRGNLYAAGGDEVTKISPEGRAKHFADIPTGEEPSIDGLAIDVHDNLYLSTDAPFHSRIMRVTPGGKRSVFATLRTNEHQGALAFDAHGNLLLAIWNPDSILSFSPAGRRRAFAAVPGSRAVESLANDSWGSVYAADFNRERIFKIPPTGSPVTKFASIEEPMSLAFGPVPKR